MANKLEKLPGVGGGGGGGSDDGSGGGGGGGGGGLTEGTPCFYAAATAIAQLFPGKNSVYIAAINKFKVDTSNPAQYYYVTGSCSGGYVSLSYEYVDTTAYPRSA